MLSAFFAIILAGALAYAAVHFHRVYLKGYGQLYLVYLKERQGALVVGKRVHRRLIASGRVQKSFAL